MQLVTNTMPDHEVLRRPAREIVFPVDSQVKQFLHEMQEFFANLKSPFGKPAGLAATQVGMPWRVIIIQVPPEAKQVRKDVYDTLPPTFIINPVYIPNVDEGKTKDWEGCYSVPDKMGEVYRYTSIQYSGYAPDGKKIEGIAKGFLARLIQHEVGHLNGELYTDLLCDDCRFGLVDVMLKIRQSEMQQIRS
jgi:peptide deformylase